MYQLNSSLFLAALTVLITVQLRGVFQAQAKVLPPSDISGDPDRSDPFRQVRRGRQVADVDNIDTDGVYGYIPRVVHGVNKIVKGLLNGSMHDIFHGAFGIAPEDVADDLIGTYNQIMGIPDPDDLDLDETTEKTKQRRPATKPKPKPVAGAATGTGQKTPGGNAKAKVPQANGGGGKEKVVRPLPPKITVKPLKTKVDIEEDDAAEEDDDDDERRR